MFILVAGGGKVGANLARALRRMNHEVTIIEQRRERFVQLEDQFEHAAILGDATELFVLELAGIEEADAVVVATNGDNTNIVVGQVAQKRFGIECTVVRILDPARAELYATLGLRTVSPTSTAIEVLSEAVKSCAVRPVRAPAAAS